MSAVREMLAHATSGTSARAAASPEPGAEAVVGSTRACAGVVLAGGLSTRMGTPKALLPFGGVPLLRRVADRLAEVFDEVVVVAAEGQDLPDAGVRMVRDRRPRRGPLGGLEVALASVSAEAVFAVSCDAPWLQPALARRVVELSRGFDAAVPRWQGRLHPLAAVYRTRLLPEVRRLLDAERLRPAFLFETARTRVVEEDEIRAVDPAGLSLVNLNSPDDYAAALATAPPRVTFELFGQPRVLAGRVEVAVDVPRPAGLAAALAALAREAPALVGPVLAPDGEPLPTFLLSVDGREFTRDLDRGVADGDRVLLLAAAAGG